MPVPEPAARLLLLPLLLAASLAAAEGPPPKQARIAMVLPRDEQNIEAGFRETLAKRNVPHRIEVIRYSGRSEDAAALVAQLRKLAPDLIYTYGTGTTLAVAGTHDTGRPHDHIRDIPVVFTEVTDPLGSRLLRQLAPPGRNVTGVSHVAPIQVQLNAIRSYRPFTRLGYITNPKEPNTQLVLQQIRAQAGPMKFEVVDETVPLDANGDPDAGALPALIGRIAARKVDFLYIGPSTFLALTHRDLVTQSALDAKLPTFCATESIVRKAKCMFGLFSNSANVGRFAGYKASQVLLEKVPVEKIPAETLQRFSLLVNMPVVRELKVYPPLLLLDAAEVIE